MIGGFANLNQFDPDAGAFINATRIGGIEAEAINNLVNQLKTVNLWQFFSAIYPMVGGTAFTHKFNLVNPQDTNTAFRLNFVGGWTHNSSGAKPDGVSGTYADTFLNTDTCPQFLPLKLQTDNGHLSYYSFTDSAAADDVEIGSTDTPAPKNECLIAARFSDSNFYVFWSGTGGAGGGTSNTNSSGFYVNNKLYGAFATIQGWRNGSKLISTGTSNQIPPSNNFYLGAENNGTGIYRNSSRGCCFSSIGGSFRSDADVVNFTNIVNNFNRTLNRNTF